MRTLVCICVGVLFVASPVLAAPLPLVDDFESYPVPPGDNPGWEQGSATLGTGLGTIEVIDTDSAPGGGTQSLRFLETTNRNGLAKRWDSPASDPNGVLYVNYDFKIVQHSQHGLGVYVSGFDAANKLDLNVFNLRYDSDSTQIGREGWHWYADGSGGWQYLGGSKAEVEGYWFNFDAVLDVAARTVDLTMTRSDGGLTISDVIMFQGFNPLDGDIANFEALYFWQSTAGTTTELLIDNVDVTPEPGAIALLGFGAVGLLARRRR